MGVDFAHLHVHTEYSLLDGFSRIKTLVKQAKSLGMQHLAITDHGAMYGAIDFYKACKAEGINPIIGVEAYLTEDIHDRSRRFKDDYNHLLILAKNNVGYHNLLKLNTIANTEGVHAGKARIDKSLLEKYGEGLIATSSCLAGEIPQMLMRGEVEKARQAVRWYQDVLGPENFYLELQDHHGIQDGKPSPQGEVNRMLYDIHKELQVPLLATNDLHYVHNDDYDAHDILLCVQMGKHRDETKRLKFDSNEYYLRSPEEMLRLFPELPDAITNSVRIAEQCNVDPLEYKAALPDFPIPEGYATQGEFLYELCLKGVDERFGQITEPIKKQLDYEFNLIQDKGFVPYFLIEWDFVNFARQNGIRCLARGSAAGSVLAYALGITNVDPLRYQLLFERFLNPERSDMPDIDMDFPDDRREEVIDYVAKKYGADCVAQMVTFNTMAAKASVKDVSRVLRQQPLGDQITRLIPTGPKVTLKGSLESVKELKDLYDSNQVARELLDQALELEGSIRSTGTHAAGVVVGNKALDNFVPLRSKDYKDASAGRETQYEQKHLEELGLIKYDFLGLSNLTILDNAVKFIKASRNEDIILEKVPLDPVEGWDEQNERRQKAFELLASGETTGIFQLEGAKMREYIKLLKPTCIEDVTAMVALYRPGPMDSIPDFIDAKHGRKKIKYLDPRLEQWLAESYGVIVYQDQVLLIAVHLAGFSWGKVNKFRKALSKKIMHEVEGYKEDFIQGCLKNGVKQEVAEELFTLILPFGGYGFNKAHAASYAVVAFYTAYLKANYTAEFMAATMTTEAADARKIANAIAECKRMGVDILGPDVSKSEGGFTVEEGNIRFGLLAIKGIGEGPTSEVVRERKASGPYKSLADFCMRIDPRLAGKGAIETLIKAGAFDSLGKRHILLESVERAIVWGKNERTAASHGLVSLFGDLQETESAFEFSMNTNAAEVPRNQLLAWEKELIGVYVSQNPLEHVNKLMEDKGVTHNIGMLSEEHSKQKVQLGGTITEARRITTKKGDTMCVVKLEDMYGSVNLTVFPRLYEQTASIWEEAAMVVVYGEVQVRNDELNIVCDRAELFKASEAELNRKSYHVWLMIHVSGENQRAVSDDIIRVQDVYNCIRNEPGHDHYELLVVNGEWQVLLTPTDNTMRYTQEVHTKLEAVLGKGAVEVKVLD